MNGFIIIRDSDRYKDCLVCVCDTSDNANKVLERMLNNPNENDKQLMKGLHNFRTKEVLEKDC